VRLWQFVLLVVNIAMIVAALVIVYNADADIQYVREHPVTPMVRIEWRTKIVYRNAPDVNAMKFKALGYCRGDQGAPSILMSWFVPGKWQAICAGGHLIFDQDGHSFTQGRVFP
jgi:hypothetical protein